MNPRSREVRDVIHGFILFSELERKCIDSGEFQRLRQIRQLSLGDQVYPGGTHTRLEHSLGTMDVATRMYDSVISKGLPPVLSKYSALADDHTHWRQKLRFAALLHDLGHLPFSHSAETALLPSGWDHERLTAEIIRKTAIAPLLESNGINVEHVIAIAVPRYGRIRQEAEEVRDWIYFLSKIISGPIGADRMDYLLRDSYHTGVTYGLFDTDRIITGLAIIEVDKKPYIGIVESSLHNAEALMLARYYMYTQVYLHKHRRIYDIHLVEFLKKWLPEGKFPITPSLFLQLSDSEIFVALRDAIGSEHHELRELSMRVIARKHFRPVITATATDLKKEKSIFNDLYKQACLRFGIDNVRQDVMKIEQKEQDFPVLLESGRVGSSLTESDVIRSIPSIHFGYIYVNPDSAIDAKEQLSKIRSELRAKKIQKKIIKEETLSL